MPFADMCWLKISADLQKIYRNNEVREEKLGEKTIEENTITEGIILEAASDIFLPVMLGTLIQQLYTTVDTIIVGRFVGKAALASVGGPAAVLSTIVVTFFNGLANGAGSCHCAVLRSERQRKTATGLLLHIYFPCGHPS